MIGDPAGIGPEITAKCLSAYKPHSGISILLVGDRKSFDRALGITGISLSFEEVDKAGIVKNDAPLQFLDIPVERGEEIPFGEVSAEAGAMVYKSLKTILALVDDDLVQGFVFAPFNKEALKKGGCPFSSELEMYKAHFNRPDVNGEINYLEPFWANRVTSHIAVKDIPSFIKKDRILETISFLDTEMERFGVEERKIAVAALNPHGGEKGLFGTEEIDEIRPAVEEARKSGISVDGPFPADTIFLKVRKGEYNAVVSMYHDQGQVATKLIGFDKGVTVHGGMPVAIATCAHGTAFDIAGTGKADANALMQALKLVLSSVIE